jgi:hypothetical protein
MNAVEPIDGSTATPAELRRAGIEALVRALGPVGMARFFQQFDLGHEDYTAERDNILGNPQVDELTSGRWQNAYPPPQPALPEGGGRRLGRIDAMVSNKRSCRLGWRRDEPYIVRGFRDRHSKGLLGWPQNPRPKIAQRGGLPDPCARPPLPRWRHAGERGAARAPPRESCHATANCTWAPRCCQNSPPHLPGLGQPVLDRPRPQADSGRPCYIKLICRHAVTSACSFSLDT